MRPFAPILALVALLPAAAFAQNAVTPKQVVEAFNKMAFEEKRTDEAIDKYLSPDFIEHDPRINFGNREGLKQEYRNREATVFKRTTYQTRVFGDGEYVVVHHLRFPEPGKPDRMTVDIFRVKNGLIVEHWDVAQYLTPTDGKNPHPLF